MSAKSLSPNVPLASLYQIAYVTTDLDEAMQIFAGTHGIHNFRVQRDKPAPPGMPNMSIHAAHAYVGAIQIELIQPAGGEDFIYRELLADEEFAIRFHHLGFMVDSEEAFDRLAATLEAHKLQIAFSMEMPGVGRALYADARATLGHYVEYLYLTADVRHRYYADVPRN